MSIVKSKEKLTPLTAKTKKMPVSKQTVKSVLSKQVDPDINPVQPVAVDPETILQKAPAGSFDPGLTPMLATLVDEPFDDPGWTYEVKWDGYRALAFMNDGSCDLKSRNNKSFNDKFYPVLTAIKDWKINAIVDGEVVVVNEKGISNFNSLQNWRSEADGELLFYVFDILWLEGKDLKDLPQKHRSAVLQTLIPKSGIIRSGFSIEGQGTEFFQVAKNMGLEGIIAKRSDSLYIPGDRSKNWLKIKVQKRQEVVIAGFTRNEGTSKLFSALLLGAYQNGELTYVG